MKVYTVIEGGDFPLKSFSLWYTNSVVGNNHGEI